MADLLSQPGKHQPSRGEGGLANASMGNGGSSGQRESCGIWQRWEKLLAMGLVLIVLTHLGLYGVEMARSSLYTDELGSVIDFCRPGPWYAMTHYPIPQNHILFSLLNSLIPGAGSLDPLRARCFSYLFAIILGTAILRHYWIQGLWAEGAVLLAFWGLRGELIQLSLQGRGYGLLCLLALLSSFLALRYMACRHAGFAEHGSEKEDSAAMRAFAGLALCTVLGAYTVPTYAVFGGVLLFLLAIVEGDLRALAVTAGTALLIAILYSPVARELLRATATYKEKYGEFYTGLGSIEQTLTDYLWPVPGWVAVTLLGLVVAGPVLILPKNSPKARALFILMVATGFFLGVCLYLRTPPVRTTAFIALPVAFCTVECLGILVRTKTPKKFANMALPGLCGIGALLGTLSISAFDFVPYENWSEVWRFLQTMYPEGTPIDFSRKAGSLTYYVDQDHYRLIGVQSSREQFASGLVPIVSAPWNWEPRYFPLKDWSPAGLFANAQGKIRTISVLFSVPVQSGIRSIEGQAGNGGGLVDFAALVDRNPNTSAALSNGLRVRLKPAERWHSLNLAFEQVPEKFRPKIRVVTPGGSHPLESNAVVWLGNVCSVSLGDVPVEALDVQWDHPGLVKVKEIWAMPCAGDKPGIPPREH